MSSYQLYKNELLALNQDLSSLISTGSTLPGITQNSFEQWERACSTLNRQLSEENLRVAVVGAIKSGKSTFLNSLLKGDYLKRGAGVVTSIVTRIRSGKHSKASLIFKSWPEVNEEITEALVTLPNDNLPPNLDQVDIQDSDVRKRLRYLLDNLPQELFLDGGTKSLNTTLLSCFLDGFEEARNLLDRRNASTIYEGDDFRRHWKFVGNDSMAVYLKDVELEIRSDNIEINTELADCQGSDSPNPIHLAMIQEYVQLAHFVLYVISSRTGLREADIRFLSILKKMGIVENAIFIVNCDISEHESLEDLKGVVNRVREELRLLLPDPDIFVFSALYELFSGIENNLPEKDRLRLALWETQKEIKSFCISEYQRFRSVLGERLIQKRSELMLRSQIERHHIILNGLGNWIHLNRELLTRTELEAREIIANISSQRERVKKIKSMIQTTSDGAVPKIKNELNTDINRFFDVRSGDCVGTIIEFIRGYRVDYRKYEDHLKPSAFLGTLYAVFQEFKQSLDRAMTSAVYPEVIRFVRQEEEKIEKYFKSIFEPYEGIIDQSIAELNSVLKEYNIAGDLQPEKHRLHFPTIESVKEMTGLKLPPLVAFLRYSAKIKTEAFVKLGFYSTIRAVKKLLGKDAQTVTRTYKKALDGSVNRMKKMTEESIIYQFKDYRENLKFKYLYRLTDAASQELADTLTDRFQLYSADTGQMVGRLGDTQSDRVRTVELIREMENQTRAAGDKITHLRHQIETTVG